MLGAVISKKYLEQRGGQLIPVYCGEYECGAYQYHNPAAEFKCRFCGMTHFYNESATQRLIAREKITYIDKRDVYISITQMKWTVFLSLNYFKNIGYDDYDDYDDCDDNMICSLFAPMCDYDNSESSWFNYYEHDFWSGKSVHLSPRAHMDWNISLSDIISVQNYLQKYFDCENYDCLPQNYDNCPWDTFLTQNVLDLINTILLFSNIVILY